MHMCVFVNVCVSVCLCVRVCVCVLWHESVCSFDVMESQNVVL